MNHAAIIEAANERVVEKIATALGADAIDLLRSSS